MNKISLFVFSHPSDVDECAAVPHPCDNTNGGCEDTDGSYNCICNPGYELNIDGIMCDGKFI